MRAALLISGHARFCESFDVQLAALKNYDSIDWFVTLWNTNSNNSNPAWVDIGASWQYIDTIKAKKLIEDRLPINHKLVHIDVIDQDKCPPNPHNIAGWYYDEDRLWAQYTILRWCDQVRQKYEQQNDKYDVIIRSRPDIAIDSDIDLAKCAEILKKNPIQLILPFPDRSGSRVFNDKFMLCNSDAMTIYSSAMDRWVELYQSGIKWNPEELMGAVMANSGYNWPATDFNCEIRKKYGKWITVDNHNCWVPKFGKW